MTDGGAFVLVTVVSPNGRRPRPTKDRMGGMQKSPAASRAVIVYIVVAYALAWLVCLPLWLGGGLASPLFLPCSVTMMFTPLASAFVATRFVQRTPLRTLGLGAPKPVGRFIGFLAVALVGVLALVLAAQATSALLGQYRFDLVDFSGLRELVTRQLAAVGKGVDSLGMSLQVLAAVSLVQVVVGSFINTVPAFGEEVGWRGFLFPRLQELFGPAAAVVGTGVVWGLWHAPLILLGYNYPSNPVLGLGAMCVMTTLFGAVLGWLRQRSGSVWPAALAHGTLNAAVGSFAVVLGAAGQQVDTFVATIMGWSGWPIPLLVAAVLLWRRAFRPYAAPEVQPTSAGATRLTLR
jgi:uncharacterized protein